jgi:hypothetical protein
MSEDDESGNIWNEAIVSYAIYFSGIFLERNENTTKLRTARVPAAIRKYYPLNTSQDRYR